MAETEDAPAQRFEIRPGGLVVGPDEDEVGRVGRVVVRPGSGEVTGVVVRRGLLLRRAVVVPIEAVTEASEDVVRVGLTADQLNALPGDRAADSPSPPAGGRGPAAFLFRLPGPLDLPWLRPAPSGQPGAAGGGPSRTGQRVVGREGEVGPLDLVLLDAATHHVTGLVVRRGGPLGSDRIVPVEWVRRVSGDRVFLDATHERLDGLPEFRPDDEIAADVLDDLWARSGVDPEDLQNVGVRAADGIVELYGTTGTRGAKAAIEAVARRGRGVLGVRNRLETFEELAASTE
jgi:uncharacterized protein YrrD